MARLLNKTVLITGAASGVGEAIAELFIQQGAVVVISDENVTIGEAIASELGPKALFQKLDVNSESDWINILDYIARTFEKLDVLVNNNNSMSYFNSINENLPCGLNTFKQSEQYNGSTFGFRNALSLLQKAVNGCIVNISADSKALEKKQIFSNLENENIVAENTRVLNSIFSESLYTIRCNSIHPKSIQPTLWEAIHSDSSLKHLAINAILKEDSTLEQASRFDVAQAALFLASDESNFISGQNLYING